MLRQKYSDILIEKTLKLVKSRKAKKKIKKEKRPKVCNLTKITSKT